MTNDYVLADDLSGALEAGAAFRARGRRVVLQLGEAVSDVATPGTLTLLSTETRNARGAAAAARVRQMLVRQRLAGARLLMMKIDSTLRGPLGEEIKAIIDELAPPLVVVCPANPALGRTVRDGILLINGVPVADTEFRRDPGWPVTESRIAVRLSEGGLDPVASLPLARLLSEVALSPRDCRGLLVSDAVTEADLERLVALVCRQEPDAIFVGAGGLARALAARSARYERCEPPVRATANSVLVVSGSLNEKSQRQIEVLRDVHRVPLHRLGLAAGTEHEAAARVARSLAESACAALTIADESLVADSAEPVQKLAGVIKLLSDCGTLPEMLAVTGGETARAICDALQIAQLDLVGEIQRGVVVSRVSWKGSRVLKFLVIKPGGFGSDNVWDELIRTG